MTRKILFITPVPPYPADSGGAQRSFLLYQSLKLLGQVDTVLITAQPQSESALAVMRKDFGLKAVITPHAGTFTLRRLDFGYGPIAVNVLRLTRWLLKSRYTLFKSKVMARQLQAMVSGGGYEMVVGRYMWPIVQTGVIDHLPTYLDFDDLESEVWQSRSDEAGGSAMKAYYRQIADDYSARQRRLAHEIAGGWVAKPRDAERLDRSDLAVLPNIPFGNYPTPTPPLPYTGGSALNVLGVAAFDYRPNLLGFDWFVTQVWPRIVAKVPTATLNLVGKLKDEAVAARWRAVPGVVVHGRVPELQPFYESALFSVAPIFHGGGTNIKVIEALVYGRCCVGTTHAVKGFEGLQGLYESRDADDYVRHCLTLLESPAQCVAQGQASAAAAAEKFSFAEFSQAVAQVINGR